MTTVEKILYIKKSMINSGITPDAVATVDTRTDEEIETLYLFWEDQNTRSELQTKSDLNYK